MDTMNEKEKTNSEFKRLKIWLEQHKITNQVKSFNRTSHYSRDVCY